MITRHHIIPRSRDGNDHIDNIFLLERKIHQKLHNFFGVALPHEQILAMADIASTALQTSFRRDLMQVIGDHEDNYYKGHVIEN